MSGGEESRDPTEALGALSASAAGQAGLGEALTDVPSAVLMVDTGTGAVVHANPPALALCGLALPAPVRDWVGAAGLLPAGSSADNPLVRVAEGEAVLGEPVLAPVGPGSERRRALWVTAFPLPPLAGRPDLALVALLPVDPGFSVEGALHEVRSRALSAAGLSFTISDPHQPDNPLVWVNPAFSEVTGFPASDALGRNCRFLQGEGTDPSSVRRLREAIEAGLPVRETLLNYRADGTPFWNEVTVTPVLDGAGQVTHHVGVQADVTSRVDAELARQRHLEAEQDARQRAEDAGRRLRLLSEATDVLVTTLDTGEALSRLSALVVPDLADWAVVDLVDGPGTHRVSATHVDPGMTARLRTVERLQPAHLDDASPVREVLRHGRSIFLPEVPPGMGGEVTADPALVAAYEELGYASAMLVPLLARHQVLGVLTLVRTTPERRYVEGDLALAEDLGRRVALIVDNARLYERQRSIASELQRALVPSLPGLASVDIDAGYLPGADGAQVGGDWYDVLPTPDGGAVIVVGDVSGHDVTAAAAMGQFRSVLRAFAWEGHDPATALTKLDEVTEALGIRQVASIVCGRLSPTEPDGAVRFTWSTAGHLPPLLARSAGGVDLLDGARSAIVGLARTAPRGTADVLLQPDDVLVLYTDGLVEDRDRLLDDSVAELAEELAGLRGANAPQVCAALLEGRAHRAARDDLTVLVARVRAVVPVAGGTSDADGVRESVLATVRLPVTRNAPGMARRAVRDALQRHRPGLDPTPLVLVTSELVTNSVVNGAGSIRLRLLAVDDSVLRVEVEDDAAGSVPGAVAMPGLPAHRGRGLPIVDSLADRWGVRALDRGKAVFAELG